jgi:hypothetical protein
MNYEEVKILTTGLNQMYNALATARGHLGDNSSVLADRQIEKAQKCLSELRELLLSNR